MGTNIDDLAKLEGTKDADRIIVSVTMADGKSYRVIDRMIAYRTRS